MIVIMPNRKNLVSEFWACSFHALLFLALGALICQSQALTTRGLTFAIAVSIIAVLFFLHAVGLAHWLLSGKSYFEADSNGFRIRRSFRRAQRADWSEIKSISVVEEDDLLVIFDKSRGSFAIVGSRLAEPFDLVLQKILSLPAAAARAEESVLPGQSDRG